MGGKEGAGGWDETGINSEASGQDKSVCGTRGEWLGGAGGGRGWWGEG